MRQSESPSVSCDDRFFCRNVLLSGGGDPRGGDGKRNVSAKETIATSFDLPSKVTVRNTSALLQTLKATITDGKWFINMTSALVSKSGVSGQLLGSVPIVTLIVVST